MGIDIATLFGRVLACEQMLALLIFGNQRDAAALSAQADDVRNLADLDYSHHNSGTPPEAVASLRAGMRQSFEAVALLIEQLGQPGAAPPP